MRQNCSTFAANWWSNLIKDSNKNLSSQRTESCFKKFEAVLADQIKKWVESDPSVTISTYGKRSDSLDLMLTSVGLLSATIPSGYEMKIIMNNVFVYDSMGKLVASSFA